MRALRIASVGAAALALMVGGFYATGYRLNVSDSLPPGVWRVQPGAPVRGAVVLACPPNSALFRAAREAHYIARGVCPGGLAPLLKPVAAVAGDRVVVTASGIAVNGAPVRNTARFSTDLSGRALPSPPDNVSVVPEGQVWLLSSYNRRSFDSRYFGPVTTSRIQGVARPVYLREKRS